MHYVPFLGVRKAKKATYNKYKISKIKSAKCLTFAIAKTCILYFIIHMTEW